MLRTLSIVLILAAGCATHPAQAEPPATQPSPIVVQTQAPRIKIDRDGSIIAPPGTMIRYEETEDITDQRPTTSRTDTASAEGATTEAKGHEAKLGAENKPGEVGLGALDSDGVGGGESRGKAGASSSSLTVQGVRPQPWMLYVLGGLLLAGGIALAVYAPTGRKAGIGLALGGAAVIGAGVIVADYPGLAASLVAIAVLAGIGLLAWSVLGQHRTIDTQGVALGNIVEAVHTAPAAAAEAVKARVDYLTDRADEHRVRDLVEAVKRRRGLKKPEPQAVTHS